LLTVEARPRSTLGIAACAHPPAGGSELSMVSPELGNMIGRLEGFGQVSERAKNDRAQSDQESVR